MEDAKTIAGKKVNWPVLMCIACLVIGGYAGALIGIGYASDTKDREWQARLDVANEAAQAKAVDGQEIGKLVRLWALEKKLDEKRLAAIPGSNDQTMRTFRYILVRPAFGDVWRGLTAAEKAVAGQVCLGPDGTKVDIEAYLSDPRSLDFVDGMTEAQDAEAQKIEEEFGKWLIGVGLIPRFDQE